VYVAGETESSDFPTTSGAYDPSEFLSCHSHGCFTAAFLTKFSVDGSKVLYSTYLYNTGGLEDEESVSINGIAVDSAGNAFVTGTTYGGGFPTTASAFQNGDNLSPEAFLTKFNSTGSELLYSTVFGSEGGSAQGSAVALDGTGKAVIAGWTDDIDLPTTPGASQSLYGGGYQDAFVAKFDTTQSGVGSLVFCTYLGGDGQEQATGIVLDSSENSYVSGTTDSRTFPHGHSFGGTSTGGAFVTKLNPTGTGLIFSTLVGGASSGPYGALSSATVGIDSGRNAYLAGTASGSNFPVTTGVVQPKFGGGQTDGFLTKLNSSGSALIFSTYIGGSLDDAVAAMTVDSSGNPIIVGATSSPDFKTTLNAFQRVFGGHYDATVMKLNSAGTSRIYSSFLGGGGTDSALAVTVDKSNNVYVAGETNSLAFPTTQRAYQSSNRGAYDAFVSKLISLCALSSNMPSVTICSPKSEANIVSPVTIIAGTTDTHPVKLLQVYVDGSKRYEAKLSAIDLHLPMNTGPHRLTVQALDLSGVWFKKTIYITVP
jgi:hypothetical protein